VVFAVAAAFVGGAVAGFLVKDCGPREFTLAGRPYSTAQQIGVTVDGWSYGIPRDIRWAGVDGVWHDDGRPACLPPVNDIVGPVTFGAVETTLNGTTLRLVTWVSCKSP
jgi:hypothetical protein